jgi:uncharacterized membrane protein (UPF0136 family)
MDRRLSWMVVAFGALVVLGGVIGFWKGSAASLASGGSLGLTLAAAGILMVRGVRAAVGAAIALTFVTALLMAWRLHTTGRLVPSLPVGVLAMAIFGALVADRRRRALGGRRR